MTNPDYLSNKITDLTAGGDASVPPEVLEDQQKESPQLFNPTTDLSPNIYPDLENVEKAKEAQEAFESEKVRTLTTPEGDTQPAITGTEEKLEKLERQLANVHYNLRKGNEERALELATPKRDPLPPEPDVEEDPERYAQWHKEAERRDEEDEEIRREFAENKAKEVATAVTSSETNFRMSNPDYDQVIQAAHQVRVRQYMQQMGYSIQQAQETVARELMTNISDMVDRGQDPASNLYTVGKNILTSAGVQMQQPTQQPNQQGNPQQATNQRPLPSLSQVGGGGAGGQPPPQGMGIISAEQFYSKVPYDTRIAIEVNHPGFMKQLRANQAARIPSELEGLLRG